MTKAKGPAGRRLACRLGGLLLVFVLAPAGAQYIKIPDFRNPSTTASPSPAGPCSDCGVIRAIRETQSQRAMAVPQGVQNPQLSGGPETTVRIGAVMALPMGEGGNEQSFVGGIGTPEMRARFAETNYEITVLLDSGAYAVAQRRDGARFRVGDRVRMRGIELELLRP